MTWVLRTLDRLRALLGASEMEAARARNSRAADALDAAVRELIRR